jgi:multidrug efflux pump subunit AcrA (membrane-fusion protein)
MKTAVQNTPLSSSQGQLQAPVDTEAAITPMKHRRGRWIRFLTSIITVSVLVGGAVWFFHHGQSRADLPTYKVGLEILQPTYQTRGDLDATQATDVVCRVKARTTGSTFSTTILWVIEDGSSVRRGEVLVRLDDSALREDLRTQQVALDIAKADWIAAQENYKIVTLQNQGDILQADQAFEISGMDLQKYVHGDFQQARMDLEEQIHTAESTLTQWREHAAWSMNMLRKGFMTENQARSDRYQAQSAELNLKNLREQLRVLSSYTKQRNITDLEGKRQEAGITRRLARKAARGKEKQANADCLTKKDICQVLQRRCQEIEQEISKCTITAPHDGEVYYWASRQSRYGMGSQQSIVAQGEPVWEGEKLMRVANLTKLQVTIPVIEALVTRLHPGTEALVRFPGLPKQVFHAHVKNIGNVPAYLNGRWDGVLVYSVLLGIDEYSTALKPTMTADVTVELDHSSTPQLTIPKPAVVHTIDQGPHGTCYVLTPDGPEQRDILIGQCVEDKVEILTGLQAGEEVVLSPGILSGEY